MKQLTSIPKHYRHLKPGDTFKSSDLCYFGNLPHRDHVVTRVGCWAGIVGYWPQHQFFRRKHVRTRIRMEQPTPKKPELPLVEFSYPRKGYPGQTSIRAIRMIACNWHYVIGLDVHDKFRVKKFSRSKIINGIRVMEFNTTAIK